MLDKSVDEFTFCTNWDAKNGSVNISYLGFFVNGENKSKTELAGENDDKPTKSHS